jgi:hypothetical protein
MYRRQVRAAAPPGRPSGCLRMRAGPAVSTHRPSGIGRARWTDTCPPPHPTCTAATSAGRRRYLTHSSRPASEGCPATPSRQTSRSMDAAAAGRSAQAANHPSVQPPHAVQHPPQHRRRRPPRTHHRLRSRRSAAQLEHHRTGRELAGGSGGDPCPCAHSAGVARSLTTSEVSAGIHARTHARARARSSISAHAHRLMYPER